MGIRCADHATPLYPQKLALTSPTGGGRSVGIVRSRTKATGLSLYLYFPCGPYGLYRSSMPVQGCTLPSTLRTSEDCVKNSCLQFLCHCAARIRTKSDCISLALRAYTVCWLSNVRYSMNCSWLAQGEESPLILVTTVGGLHVDPDKNASHYHYMTFSPVVSIY